MLQDSPCRPTRSNWPSGNGQLRGRGFSKIVIWIGLPGHDERVAVDVNRNMLRREIGERGRKASISTSDF